MTSTPGIFVAGDLQTGPRLIIDAVASGKRAARGVFEHVTGRRPRFSQTESHFEIGDYHREPDYETVPRAEVPTIDPGLRRSMSETVELGYGKADALREASRCLDCGVNTIFNGERCILCGGCADVCPELCLKLVPVTDLGEGDDALGAVLSSRCRTEDRHNCSVILKNEDRCIRCGLCAERCPAEAITMEQFCFTDRMSIGLEE